MTASDADDRAEQPASSRASRRDFVRVALRDTMGTAGQLAGLSGVVATSVAEAGRVMREGLEALADDEPSPAAERPATSATLPVSSLVAGPRLAREQMPSQAEALLSGVQRGVLATVTSDGSPLLASGPVRYDGSAFLASGRQLSAKVANVTRDGRVSLVISTAAGDALVVGGRARIEAGADAARTARELYEELGAVFPPGWSASDERGDLVLLVIEPVRALWRRGDAAP